jgi:hypothetical protein
MLFVLAALVAAVVTLHRLGREPGLHVPLDHLDSWLRTTPPTDAVLGIARLVGLAAAWWLLGSTVLYTVARLSRRSSAQRAVRWVTLPGVRRWIDRALAASLVAGTVLGSGGAAVAHVAGDPEAAVAVATTPTPPPVRTGRAGDPAAIATTTTTTPDEGRSERAVGPAPDSPTPVEPAPDPPASDAPGAPDEPPDSPAPPVDTPGLPTPVPAEPAPDPAAPIPGGQVPGSRVPRTQASVSHVVVPGDSLWSIAAAHLAAVAGRVEPSDAEITRYWVEVCAVNRARLRSGNLDLIFPGEVVDLPPIT